MITSRHDDGPPNEPVKPAEPADELGAMTEQFRDLIRRSDAVIERAASARADANAQIRAAREAKRKAQRLLRAAEGRPSQRGPRQ